MPTADMRAAADAASIRAEARIGRELMRLECARQAIDDEISALRQLQAGKVS